MNRRRFLSWLGAGMVVGAVAPYALKASAPTLLGEEQSAGWVDYKGSSL
jgi:hypothetical protein